MKIQDETIVYFQQDKRYVLDYLKNRGISNRVLNRIIRGNPFGLLLGVSFKNEGVDYEISHFLSKSDVSGYDIKKANTLLETDGTNLVAFALVVGDDVLCCDAKTQKVYLWCVQTDDGQKKKVSDNLTEFLNNLNIAKEE